MRSARSRSGSALSVLLVSAATVLGAQSAPTKPAPAPQPAVQKLPPAREILDRHVEAVGGRKAILSHSSTRAKGKAELPSAGLAGDLEVLGAKPNKTLIKFVLPGVGEIQEGFNGTVGWSMSALTGPQLLEGKQLEERRFDSDFYSDLRPDSAYESLQTVELTTFDGRPCHKVRLVRKGGSEDFEYFDAATGLRAGKSGSRETPMGTLQATTIESDYRKFGNLLVPTKIRQTAMGVETVLTLSEVVFDDVPESAFDPPAPIKALIK
jgi:hypothetical protein